MLIKEIKTENLIVEVKEEIEGVLEVDGKRTETYKTKVELTKLKEGNKVEVVYKTMDDRRNEYILSDEKGKVSIENAYQVWSCDDIDWDFRSILPCDRCESVEGYASRDRAEKEEAEKENKKLKEIIKTLTELLK